MGDSHIINDPAELASLESSCKSFSDGLNALAGKFQSETDALAGAWRDSMYNVLRARIEPIFSECGKALSIVNGSLTPFIEKKRQWAESRPNA